MKNIKKEEQEKITVNTNKIDGEKLKSFYKNKISWYNFLGFSFGLFGLFLIINSVAFFFDSQITNLFIEKNGTSLFNATRKSMLIGLVFVIIGSSILNTKTKKYEKLLKELK